MSDRRPNQPESKEQLLLAVQAELQGLQRALDDLNQAFQTQQTQSPELLRAVARLDHYINSIYGLITPIIAEPEVAAITERLSDAMRQVDLIVNKLGTTYGALTAEAKKLREPDSALDTTDKLDRAAPADEENQHEQEFGDNWQEAQQMLWHKANEILTAMRELFVRVNEQLARGPLTRPDISEIRALLAEYGLLQFAYEEAGRRFPDQRITFESDWSRIQGLSASWRTQLESILARSNGAEQTNDAEGWPYQVMTDTEAYLATNEGIRADLNTRLSVNHMLDLSIGADQALFDAANAFLTGHRVNLAHLTETVAQLNELEPIVRTDVKVDPPERQKRAQAIKKLAERAQAHIDTTAELEFLFWQRSLFINSPEANTLQTHVDAYVDIVPTSTDEAGYQQIRAGVTELEGDLAAVRAQVGALSGGDNRRRDFLSHWLDGFNGELNRRRELALQFWRDNVTTIHPEFNPATVGGPVAELGRLEGLTLTDPTLNMATIRAEVTAVQQNLLRVIDTAIAAGTLPAHATEPGYREFIQRQFDGRVQALLERIDREIAARERQAKIAAFELKIHNVEAQNLEVTRQRHQIESTYNGLHADLEKLAREAGLTDVERNRLFIEIEHAHFRHLFKAYQAHMRRAEESDWGVNDSLDEFYHVIDPLIMNHLQNAVTSLEQNHDPELVKYQTKLKQIEKDYGNRKGLHLSWEMVWPMVIGNAKGGKGRVPPRENNLLNFDNFQYRGQNIRNMLDLGVLSEQFEASFDGERNNRLGIFDVEEERYDNPGVVNRRQMDQSLFGYCWRMFDKVYSQTYEAGEQIAMSLRDDGTPTNERITTQNLHMTFDSLIKYVYNRAVAQYQQEYTTRLAAYRLRVGDPTAEMPGYSQEPPFDLHSIRLAWRMHTISTNNHIMLAPDTPPMPDFFYYMYKWPKYMLKYVKAKKSGFNPLQTLFVIGNGSNILDLIYSPKQKEDVRYRLNGKGWLRGGAKYAEEGPRLAATTARTWDFGAMLTPPLITMRNVSRKMDLDPASDTLTPTKQEGLMLMVAPPLRSSTYVVRDGNRVRRFYNREGGALVEGSVPVKFDDLKDRQDRRLYEEMPFEDIGLHILQFYNDLEHPFWMLEHVFKADTSAFVAEFSKPDAVKNLRTKAGYFTPTIEKVAGTEGEQFRVGGTRMPRAQVEAAVLATTGDIVKLGGYELKKKELEEKLRNDPSDPFRVGAVEFTKKELVESGIVRHVVLAVCMIMTDPKRQTSERWSIDKVKDYLQNLVASSAITTDEKIAVESVVIDGREWQMYGDDLTDALIKEMEQVTKVR